VIQKIQPEFFMTAKAPQRPRSSTHKAPVFRLVPTITKPLSKNCFEVVSKLKKTLVTAQAGATVGALVVTIDDEGYWRTELAGELMYDKDVLCQFACRLLGVCVTTE
jgi:hypothetical protein